MLTITNRAGAVLQATLLAAEEPLHAVRLSAAQPPAETNGANRVVQVDLVESAAPDDEILEAPGGAPVFVDVDIVPWVEDKVLDAGIDGDGRTSLMILTAREA